MNLPNLISLGRIILAVLVIPLLLYDRFDMRLLGFIVFLIAAFSDLWDGYLARSRGLVTDLGKLLDPVADKLLLVATFVPLYLLSHGLRGGGPFPFIGGVLPLWVVLLIFGRELFITLFRSYAARQGLVIPAGKAGKYKTVFQNISIGAGMLWYALLSAARDKGWESDPFWPTWTLIHTTFTVTVLSVAIALTVYSMIGYLWGYRSILSSRNRAT